MENIRYNISPCTESEVEAFIAKIDSTTFVPNGCIKSTERSHYDRYSFLSDGQRVAIVYDITASIVSITARGDQAKQLLDLFDPKNKSVKKSTVPAQSSKAAKTEAQVGEKRAKLFEPTERLKRRSEFVPVPSVLATSRGVIITTDEIYPPQTVKRRSNNNGSANINADSNTANGAGARVGNAGDAYKCNAGSNGNAGSDNGNASVRKRPLPSYGESGMIVRSYVPQQQAGRAKSEQSSDNGKACGISISIGARTAVQGAAPRRAVISFGSEDDGKYQKSEFKINTRSSAPIEEEPVKKKRGRPKKADGAKDQPQQPLAVSTQQPQQQAAKKRGRPKKTDNALARDAQQPTQSVQPSQSVKPQAQQPSAEKYEYKNGYSVKNYPMQSLVGAIKRLKEYGKTVTADGTEFVGTPQEVKAYTVSDAAGQKVILRYATKRMTLQLQGKRSELFGEVMAQVSHDSDYSSALENYVQKSNEDGGASKTKVTDVQKKLKKRLPTAYEYLSEQSRIDFSYGIHDFSQSDLHLSDYSVLLVPAFRGLESFIFDIQAARDIKVKMIGQAFDKDDSGKYVLKSGYLNRINSVIYPEVLVSLYSEYFAQRNFFAHSDNTGGNVSRSLPERAAAQKIFEHLLDVVEYNAKKLKEIGFKLDRG